MDLKLKNEEMRRLFEEKRSLRIEENKGLKIEIEKNKHQLNQKLTKLESLRDNAKKEKKDLSKHFMNKNKQPLEHLIVELRDLEKKIIFTSKQIDEYNLKIKNQQTEILSSKNRQFKPTDQVPINFNYNEGLDDSKIEICEKNSKNLLENIKQAENYMKEKHRDLNKIISHTENISSENKCLQNQINFLKIEKHMLEKVTSDTKIDKTVTMLHMDSSYSEQNCLSKLEKVLCNKQINTFVSKQCTTESYDLVLQSFSKLSNEVEDLKIKIKEFEQIDVLLINNYIYLE
ncbi:hypothetical protein HZS_3245 [Henneguya salminicola]|nr:hypothetical protein HZS_3245 [Henneguya salminicola]